MGYKTILFSSPCELSVKNRQLVYQADDFGIVTIPLEDIATIIFDTRQISLMVGLYNKLFRKETITVLF